MLHLGDITKINGAAVPAVDVIIGGSPCQDLSVAGKRAGLDGARSGLFMEQIRIIKEMRLKSNGRYPKFMVWENVPGAFSSNKSEDFRVVLEETAKIADETAVIPRPPKDKWQTAGCIMGDGWSVAWRVLDAQFWGVPQRRRRIALVADFGGQSAGEILFERESVSGDIAESGTAWEGAAGDAEGSFRAAGFCGGASPTAGGIGYCEEVSPTIKAASSGTAQIPNVYCIQGNCIDRADTAGCNGKGWTEDVSYTLNTADRPAVVHSLETFHCDNFVETASTLKARDWKDPQCVATTLVRRLTPLECERLQGFPDGWTDIGDWRDSNCKLHKITDSNRYRALGNSIALPPWTWILLRLSQQFTYAPTIASLFDGIGGFPLIWERINGRGSCLWASEIEEYPIAVTKMRIGE